jgi:hypothetical protein
MSASPHPKRRQRIDDTQQARKAAARRFVKGDRVRHRVTGKFGSFVEIGSGFALLEVWVQFDSETDIQVPTSCNPLDLELVAKDNSLARSAITPEIVEDLTEVEERDRHRLELRVERAFYEAGAALRELRDRRLYRSTHKSFEDYCRDRFGYSRQNANYFIAGADVVDDLRKLTTICCQLLPTKEIQVRPLTKLGPAEQIIAWQQAVESAGGKAPSGRIVKGIVERLKEKPLRLATDFCNVGDVFTLIGLEGEQRKYNRCPWVAVELNDFTIKVDVYDATITVKPENLNSINSPDVVRQFPAILSRIKRLQQCNLDRGAIHVLEALGRQTYLTDLEEKLLAFLEREYGIDC